MLYKPIYTAAQLDEDTKKEFSNEPQTLSSLMKTSFRKGERGGSINRYIMI